MASSNVYAKHYSNRRITNETDGYKLMLFPADNSIAVVKDKQCSVAEHDGFLLVQSGKKKFNGVVIEEGSLERCSKIADRMAKKQLHPEIESDYERLDENRSTASNKKKTTTSTISTLADIPLADRSNTTQQVTTVRTNETDQCSNLVCSNGHLDLSRSNTSDNSVSKEAPSSSIITQSVTNGSTKDDLSIQSEKRHKKQRKQSKAKRQKQCDNEISPVTRMDDIEYDEVSSDDDNQACSGDANLSVNITPTFTGRTLTVNKSDSSNNTNASSMFQRLLAFTSKIESQYLRPLLVAQERTETLAKCLFENQKKIQKVLRRQKMNISLNGFDEPLDDAHGHTFLNSLEYTTSGGVTVDLLKRSAVKEHANRYVTTLMDILYNHDELLAITTADITKDDRYLLIKEAVKHKFRLGNDELETMWVWLHTVFLAKRRTIHAKKKRQTL